MSNARSTTSDTFTSGGVPIAAARFDAAGPALPARPAVLLLHGADGPGEHYRTAARLLAGAGYHVFLIHYLDRTGERWASFASIGRNAPAWAETVLDAVAWASGRSGVDPERIGLLGVSLGGALCVAAANQDRRVRALVQCFGLMPPTLDGDKGLPPTMVLHGEMDPIVPVSNAHALERFLKARGIPHEVVIYPGQGHGFTGEAQADAVRRILAFFGRRL
jgi:carboxymethylenebutenolidase